MSQFSVPPPVLAMFRVWVVVRFVACEAARLGGVTPMAGVAPPVQTRATSSIWAYQSQSPLFGS